MKKFTLIIISFIYINSAFSQLKFNTGNAEFDANLSSINANAKLDLKTFKIDLSISHNLPIRKIEELLQIMEPAEIILAKDIADITEKKLDEVVDVYKVNKDKGWGYIAKQMGIKPGSPEFHALKGKSKKSNSKGKNKGNSGNHGFSHGKGKKK